MNWLRNVVVDLLVTVCIVAATLLNQTWAEWVVIVYTPLMLVLMVVAFFAPDLGGALRSKREVPPVFYHVLYVLNVALLVLDAQWLLAAGWVAIWGLSTAIMWRKEARA